MKYIKKVVILCLILVGALFLTVSAASAYERYDNMGSYINYNINTQLSNRYNYHYGNYHYGSYYHGSSENTYGVYSLDKGYAMNEQRHSDEAYNNYLRARHAERNRHVRWGY